MVYMRNLGIHAELWYACRIMQYIQKFGIHVESWKTVHVELELLFTVHVEFM